MDVFVDFPEASRVARTLSKDGCDGENGPAKENSIMPGKGLKQKHQAGRRPPKFVFNSVTAPSTSSSSSSAGAGGSSGPLPAATAASSYSSHCRKLGVAPPAAPFVFDEREMCPRLVGREICPPPHLRSARSPPCMVGAGFKRGAAYLDSNDGASSAAGARLVRPRAVRRRRRATSSRLA